MPTSWSSVLVVAAVALGIAGAAVWVVAAVCVAALVVEVAFDLTAAMTKK